jgi:enamine deaminase RidA (YjgF/YER057c/UK114 family)
VEKIAINAEDAPKPPPSYVQAMHVKDAREYLFISDQIGVDLNGAAPPAFDEQAKLIWQNIDAQLRAASMSKDNLVKVTIYLSDRKYIDGYRKARDFYLEGRPIALTCIIAGIFDEGWFMEIEAIAAR